MSLAEHGRTYRGAGPRQRRDERRSRLIEAAVEVFGTVGYRGATVDRLCAAAGLTKRYFYESFGGSEELLLAAYARVTDELRTLLVEGAHTAGPGLDDQVHAALRALFAGFDDDPRLAKIAFVEVLGVSPTVDATYRAVTESFADVLLGLATPAPHARGASGPDRKVVATGLVGAVVFVAQQWVLNQRQQPSDTVVSSAHTIIMATLDRLGA